MCQLDLAYTLVKSEVKCSPTPAGNCSTKQVQKAFYLFVSQFTSPFTTFAWTFDNKRKNLPFCCQVRENILKKRVHVKTIITNSSTQD